ncbi:hypothetical protein [Planococcus maitriensis]|uniref:Uncharacterized protein n=1 Tax=Planococcus maitriensis TaxID=221799 RepID=A0A365K3V2_9BACL|nr:hypothetical protein [Planococcus maitriensis]RAZ67316.1 hypothetical protein DP119_11160 [Planococcus maitriensis]
MNRFWKAIALIAALLFLGACGEQTFSNGEESGSYAGILIVEGEEYVWEGELEGSEYSESARLGAITQSTAPEVMPSADFSSNFLAEGAEIYTSNEDPDVLLAKRHDGSWDVFRKSAEQE